MIRPDQFRYDQFCRHLEQIDEKLEEFGNKHGFALEKNLHRQPARDLRRVRGSSFGEAGSFMELISVYIEDHWLKVDWHEDMLHTFAVGAFYKPTEGKRLFKRFKLVEHTPFSIIHLNLDGLLIQGLTVLESWPCPSITPNDLDASAGGWQRTLA